MEAIVLGPGEGDGVNVESVSVRTLAVLDVLRVMEVSHEGSTGSAGLLDPDDVEAFYVLDGKLEIELHEPVRASTGGFVLAPPGLERPLGIADGGARYLHFHVPGARDAQATATVVEPGEGELLEGEHRRLRVKVSRPELDVLEFEIEPGFEGPGAHYHREHVDSFYVLEGEVLFTVAGETVRAGPGAFVAAPPGVVHAFTASDRPARFLNVHAPDRGFTEYLRARARNEDVDPADYDICEVEE